MLKIFKYKIPHQSWVDGSFTIAMPEVVKFLTIQLQNNEPTLWVLIKPNTTIKAKQFVIHGTTGHPINPRFEKFDYIGTWQKDGFVWHLFEEH